MKKILIILTVIFIAVSVTGQEIKKVKVTELEKIIAESKTPLIINFWATWCKPCIEEIPYFQDAVKKFEKDSLKLLLVSLDLQEYFPGKIKAFAAKRKIAVPIVWLDEFNADYFCPKVDSTWSGAIPASLFINNKTRYRHFREEQLSPEKLSREIITMLAKTD